MDSINRNPPNSFVGRFKFKVETEFDIKCCNQCPFQSSQREGYICRHPEVSSPYIIGLPDNDPSKEFPTVCPLMKGNNLEIYKKNKLANEKLKRKINKLWK